MGLEQTEKRHLTPGVERLRELHRFAGLRQDVLLVPLHQPLRRAVGGDRLGCLCGKVDFNGAEVRPGGGNVGPSRADVALIAVEDRHGHRHLKKPLV